MTAQRDPRTAEFSRTEGIFINPQINSAKQNNSKVKTISGKLKVPSATPEAACLGLLWFHSDLGQTGKPTFRGRRNSSRPHTPRGPYHPPPSMIYFPRKESSSTHRTLAPEMTVDGGITAGWGCTQLLTCPLPLAP